MNISDMKKIADSRTKGEWGYTYYEDANDPDNRNRNIGIIEDEFYGDTIIHRDSGVYSPEKADAEFIIMAANNIDKLIAVVEAAKPLFNFKGSSNDWSKIETTLESALKELEKES